MTRGWGLGVALGLALSVAAWVSFPSARRASSLPPGAMVPRKLEHRPAGFARSAGFPSQYGSQSHRSWRHLVWAELGEHLERAGGSSLGRVERERFLEALRRLRRARSRWTKMRGGRSARRVVRAARRYRQAALELDDLSREYFGLPAAALLQRANAGVIEEVPPG